MTAVVLHGQAVDDFDPNANGAVPVIVVQPDGKILLGGDFTTLSPNGGAAVTRNHIARVTSDGTLDPAFDPNSTGLIRAMAVQADGKILVGGTFITSIGGQQRNRIARLDPTTGLADSFDPNANGTVYAIAIQADGKILVSGTFSSIGGQLRHIARLDPVTGLADSFHPITGQHAFLSLVVQGDGKILVAGAFDAGIGGQPRSGIARLDPTTGLADSFNPIANAQVNSIAVQEDGKVLAVGFFSNIGGQARNHLARLDATTGAPDSFDPNANSIVNTIAVQADGKILAGGSFNGANSIGGQSRNYIARLDPTTALADSFDPSPNSTVQSIAVQPDGKILVGGVFTSVGGQPRNSIARIDGATGIIPGTLGNISTRLRVETGDNVLIGGFIITGTQPKRVIVRGIGPSLAIFPDRLSDPTLELRDGTGALVASNDDWRSTQEAEIIATTIPPTNDLESAIVATLPANGAGYTAIVRGANDGTGIGVVEAYDLNQAVDSKLANISTRGSVQTDPNVLIAGTIVLGQTAQRVIVRALGPSLTVPGALADPTLELRDGNGGLIRSNDNWRSDQEAEIIATTIPPTNDSESAIVATLPASGAGYSAIVRGVSGTTGIAVVEIYALN